MERRLGLTGGVGSGKSTIAGMLLRHGAGEKQIEVIRVPGAFEIPAVAAAKLGDFRAKAALERKQLQSTLELVAFKATHAGWILEQGGGILRARRPAGSAAAAWGPARPGGSRLSPGGTRNVTGPVAASR